MLLRWFIGFQASTEAFPMCGVSCLASASGSATAMRVTSLMVAGSSFCVPYHWVESGITPRKSTSPLKRDHFNRTFHLPTINFEGIC